MDIWLLARPFSSTSASTWARQFAGQGGVEFGLGVLQGAAGDAFHLGRQVFGHLGLGAAQDEGRHAGAQVVQGFGVAVFEGLDDAALEGMLRTKKAGHKEFKQGPELKEVVLNGVPERQRRMRALMRRTARAVMVLGFLMFWASSRITVLNSYFSISSRSRRNRA